jgi:PKD repeat protein
VTLTVVNSASLCIDSFTSPVTVNPAPIANFVYSSPVFEDQIVQFTDASYANGAVNIVAWSWNFGDPASGINNSSNLPNPDHFYVNPGVYAVTQIVTNGYSCNDTMVKNVNVISVTTIDFTWDGQCVNYPTQFTPALNGATITQYNWQFGDGFTSTASNPMHTYPVSGTFNVTLTVTDNFGVLTNVTHAVQIFPKPIANFAATQTCFGQTTQFTDLSQAGTSGIIQWLWNFGDPASGVLNTSTVQNPEHLFTSVGLFEIQLIVTSSSGCIDTLISPLLIRSLPPVDFTVSNNCVNALVSFTPNAAVMNFGAIDSWLWDFGDGNTSTLQNPTHVYMASGTYNVTLNVTDTNGCTNYATKILTILAIPGAAFNYTFPACVQSAISFTDLSQTNGGGAIVSWQWNFGDTTSGTGNTSTLQNPVHIFNIPGTYQVMLTVLNATGCSSSITMSITVNQKPTAEFTFTAPELNQPVYFTDLSLPGSGLIVTWNWNFGDGNSSSLQNPVHTYTLPGTYSVGLIVTNESGCSNFADSVLQVDPGAGSVTLTGRVIAGNDTLNNANVHLIQLDATGLPVSLLTTSPGSDNEFIFNNIPEGNYYLHATPEYTGPFASSFLPTFYLNSLYWQSATLITLGQPENPYNIQLASYQIINGGTFIINGQIVNAGKSINPADQEVLLLDNQNNPVRWTITDSNGHFSFDSLPAGTYAVNPVITGLTTYPFYVVLNENTNPAFVKMIISGLIITANDEQKTIKQLYKIYPNPANDIITIGNEGNPDVYQVEIISISGRLLKSQSLLSGNNTFEISDLPSGLYLVKITDNKGNAYQERIIKQ